MRYVLLTLTAIAAVAFVLSVAVEAKWIGSSSPSVAQKPTNTAPRPGPSATPVATASTHVTAYYFAAPTDVKVSQTGHVYVADTLNDRVVELGRPGTQFLSWGRHAVYRAKMSQPKRVLPLHDGFAVIDEHNTRVALFSNSGALIANWTVNGTLGSSVGPTALALAPSGTLYLADGNNDRILRLNASGHVTQSWSTKGFLPSAAAGPNDPGFPDGLVIDRTGDVYVSYPNSGVVQKFSAAGTPLQKWTLPGSGATATDVAVDPQGDVYVVDGDRSTVTKFSPSGAVLSTWGGHGIGGGKLLDATAIAVDGQGHVFVSDAGDAKAGSFVKEWSSTGKFIRSYSYG
jgi:sugar lactone lactonase YvrE